MDNVNAQKPSYGLATAGLVLGIITAVLSILSLIPVIGYVLYVLCWITGSLAIIFGIIAMCKKCYSKGAWAIGLALFGWFFYGVVISMILGLAY